MAAPLHADANGQTQPGRSPAGPTPPLATPPLATPPLATLPPATPPPATLPPATLPPWIAWTFLTLACAGGVLYLADVSPTASILGVALPSFGSLAAISLGVRRNRPADRVPWRWLQGAIAVALVGSVLRGMPEDMISTVVTDTIALAAYAAMFRWLVRLFRGRDGGAQRDAIADGVLVGIATLLVAWVLLVSPNLANDLVPLGQRVLTGLFPVLDAMLVFLVLRLSFVTPSGVPSMWLLVGGLLFLLVGDLGYAIQAVSPLPFPLGDAPYAGSYAFVGAAVLHPSMVVLTSPGVPVIRPLPRFRLVVVCLAVGAPALLVFVRALDGFVDRAVVSGGILLLASVVLWRTIRAVNQHAASELRLARQATHDSLTGLPNRVRARERLGEALAEVRRHPGHGVAVLFLDLDGFKLVNDSWGHSVGDELLVAAAARLRSAQEGGELVARVGGDEFVLVLESDDPFDGPTGVARRILDRFVESFILSIGEVFVTVSIGIATSWDREDATPEELIRDADTAMYRAKGEGRNRVAVFDASMRDSVTRRVRTEVELRRALERNELQVFYQPIVAVADGALEGFEALVRWEHPERGLVPPGEFIPLVEDTDLIMPIGALVLRRAAAQMSLWRAEHDEGPGLHVAVNVAARQLRDPTFVDFVARVLTETGLPPHALTLELTESMMVEDTDASKVRLAALRQLGVALNVDDFGTGYSSLRYLKQFPVTGVKIDRAFVDGLGADPDDEAIVVAVLAMAHALGLSVVAEGVETVTQRARLLALGCDTAQGYLFGRPLPAASASRLIARPSRVAPAAPSARKVTV